MDANGGHGNRACLDHVRARSGRILPGLVARPRDTLRDGLGALLGFVTECFGLFKRQLASDLASPPCKTYPHDEPSGFAIESLVRRFASSGCIRLVDRFCHGHDADWLDRSRLARFGVDHFDREWSNRRCVLCPIAWFASRFSSSRSGSRDGSLVAAKSVDLISAFTVGIALRLFGTVALFLMCRYQLGQQSGAIAALVGVWYVLLTSVEVVSIAKMNTEMHRSAGESKRTKSLTPDTHAVVLMLMILFLFTRRLRNNCQFWTTG